MKTNQTIINRISILFFSTALLLFSLLSSAQVKVISSGHVGFGITGATTPTTPEVRAHFMGALGFPATSGTTQTAILRLQGTGSNGVLDFSVNGSSASCIQVTNRTNLSLPYPLALNPNGGNVGIGTTSPTSAAGTALTIKGATGDNRGGVELRNSGAVSGGSVLGNIRFLYASNDAAVIQVSTGTTSTTGQYQIYTRNAGGTMGERIRITQDGNVGIGTATPGTNKLSVVGNIFATGTINNTSGTFGPSDINLKQNIDSAFTGMTILKQLKPVTFDFKTAQYPRMNLPVGLQYGLIAQEVAQVLPNLVIDASLGATVADTNGNAAQPEINFKAVNYTELIPILLKGIQELNSVIENQQSVAANTSNTNDSTIAALNSKVNDLQSQIYSCCNRPPQEMGAINEGNTKLKDVTGNGISDLQNSTIPILFQNAPNPFNQHTSIQYFIPPNSQTASIMVFDLNGKLINTFPIRAFGKDAITINGSQLNPGMFVYSLIVDEKIIDTKRMILTH